MPVQRRRGGLRHNSNHQTSARNLEFRTWNTGLRTQAFDGTV